MFYIFVFCLLPLHFATPCYDACYDQSQLEPIALLVISFGKLFYLAKTFGKDIWQRLVRL
jgi:hypothetical protein